MNGADFSSVEKAMYWLFCIAAISLPFAIWKAVEIIIWLFKHVSIS